MFVLVNLHAPQLIKMQWRRISLPPAWGYFESGIWHDKYCLAEIPYAIKSQTRAVFQVYKKRELNIFL